MRKDHTGKDLYDRIFSMFKGETQKNVAETLGVSEHLVGGWKKNKSKPSLDILNLIAEIKGLPYDWWQSNKSNKDGCDDSCMDNKEFIKRVFLLYNAKNQEDLVEKLGIQQSVINGWLSGRSQPRFALMEKIVKETGCSWNWLLTGEKDKESNEPKLTPEQKAALEALHEVVEEGMNMIKVGNDAINEVLTDPEAARYFIDTALKEKRIRELLEGKKKA